MDYLTALAATHATLAPRNYLEIGCRHGLSLALSKAPAIGVDPDFEITASFDAPTQLFELTSDSFFEAHDPAELFGSPIDFAFIDGLHNAEVALRDFMNIERHAARTSVIAIDDILPEDLAYATRTRNTEIWTGDVYKVISILKRYRPDLRIDVFDVEMKGFCLISRLDPASSALGDKYGEIEADILAGRYDAASISALRADLAPRSVEHLQITLAELALMRAQGEPVS